MCLTCVRKEKKKPNERYGITVIKLVLETTQCNLTLCFQLLEAGKEATTLSEGPQMTILAIYFYNFAISHEHGEFRFYVEIL